MAELATKADVLAVRTDLLATEQRLQTELRHTEQKLQNSIEKLDNKIDTQTLRMTVRLGTRVVVGLGTLGVIVQVALKVRMRRRVHAVGSARLRYLTRIASPRIFAGQEGEASDGRTRVVRHAPTQCR